MTYKDYEWSTLIENNKVEKLKVKQLDLYLKEHGLTTVGLKLDKIKAIRCHYYRQKVQATDKGTTTVTMNTPEDKKQEGQIQLDNSWNTHGNWDST